VSSRQPPLGMVPAESMGPYPKLRGRRLLILRAVWIAVAVLVLALFLASIPITYAQYHDVCAGSKCDFWQLSPGDAGALKQIGLSADFYAIYTVALEVVYSLGFFIVGAFIFWKRSNDRMAFFVSLALVLFGTNLPERLTDVHPAWWLPVTFVNYLGSVFFFISFCLFPDGRFIPRWIRVSAAVWIAYQVPLSFFPNLLGEETWAMVLNVSLFLGLLGTLVFARIYRYVRVSGPVERLQSKWVIFGLTVAITAVAGTVLVGLIFPELRQPGIQGALFKLASGAVINLSFLLVPLSIGIAILRYHLWDLHVIINRTLVYGSLSAVLAAVFAITDTLLLPLLVQSFLGKDDPSLNAVISALIIAVIFEPLRRRIKVGVNRLTDWLAGGEGTSESRR
jgi:hypothetical protein